MALTRATITRDQLNVMQWLLDKGAPPSQVAISMSRLVELDEAETLTVLSVANDLFNGVAVHAADD